jgi:RNA polymerase primary sigma factor
MRNVVISKNFTYRESESLSKYFKEIEKIDLLSIQEEVVLAGKIREGDRQALDRLTIANLRFVISVAKQYQNQGLSLCDLINEGNMGLIIAANRYDETKGFKFISYAVWWIRQSIIMAIAQHARTVRLPCNQLSFMNKIYRAISKLEQDYSRKPTVEELAEYLEIHVHRISDLLSKSRLNQSSLDEPLGQDEERTLLDVLHINEPGADHDVVHESIIKEIQHSLKVLGDRDRELLVLFFGLGTVEPLSLEDIGKRFNISKEHAGRLKEKALGKLRKCSNAVVLMSCMT